MLEADHSMTAMAMGRDQQERVYAEFYTHPRRNQAKSLEAGRDIYEDLPYIKIMVPGDKDNIIQRPVRDQDKQRFPRQWQAFQNQDTQPMEGTPLAEWSGVTRSMVEEFKHFGIRTVEDLVNMPDSQFIQDASYSAPIEKLTRENDTLKAQLSEMQKQLERLNDRLDFGDEEVADAPKPRRRKRSGSVQDDQ